MCTRNMFFRNSKLKFLLLLIRLFFNKTYYHLTNFIHFYNFNFLIGFTFQAIFNRFGSGFLRALLQSKSLSMVTIVVSQILCGSFLGPRVSGVALQNCGNSTSLTFLNSNVA